jgi:hypothetical protein
MAARSQLVGQMLDRYRIIEQIGEGGMGVVCRAMMSNSTGMRP